MRPKMIHFNRSGLDGYLLKSYDDDGQTVSRLFDRYVGLLDSTAVHAITLVEMEWLLETTYRYIEYRGSDAREELLRTIDVGIASMNSDYMNDQGCKAKMGEPFDDGDHPNIHLFEGLRTEASHWSQLQCMKVIEALELYRARDRFATKITPTMIYDYVKGMQSLWTVVQARQG